jgi:hypothetical protein
MYKYDEEQDMHHYILYGSRVLQIDIKTHHNSNPEHASQQHQVLRETIEEYEPQQAAV